MNCIIEDLRLIHPECRTGVEQVSHRVCGVCAVCVSRHTHSTHRVWSVSERGGVVLVYTIVFQKCVLVYGLTSLTDQTRLIQTNSFFVPFRPGDQNKISCYEAGAASNRANVINKLWRVHAWLS